MQRVMGLLTVGILLAVSLGFANPSYGEAVVAVPRSPALEIRATQVQYLEDLDLLVFEQQLVGTVGSTLPQPAGQLDGAPVLGYVFPTTLRPEAGGFGGVDGILALAITSHPDFDDTPLWDEDNDANYANDGVIWHSHWVVLTSDERVPGGLSVAEFGADDEAVVMPPTHPGMAIYLDSPGFAVVTNQNTLRVLVPAQRVNHHIDFNFDAVTAYMEVNTRDASRPTLGVYEVYSVGSGDLSLPYEVQRDAS
ncbi:MAG: hypothetical protein AAGE59_23590 [Cyanobacteria bacterium P01_F01_bin.86]